MFILQILDLFRNAIASMVKAALPDFDPECIKADDSKENLQGKEQIRINFRLELTPEEVIIFYQRSENDISLVNALMDYLSVASDLYSKQHPEQFLWVTFSIKNMTFQKGHSPLSRHISETFAARDTAEFPAGVIFPNEPNLHRKA